MPNSRTLHLPDAWFRQVRTLLQTYLPEAEVWAYGSRVGGDHYEASDLDLVARFPDTVDKSKRFSSLADVKEAYSQSNLPIIVQIADWDALPQSFRAEILAQYVVVQAATAPLINRR